MFNVLIVDDEPTIREGLKTIIDWEHYGFRIVDTAANGREAIAKFNSLHPDLTIIDIRMPGMTGLEAIEQIRTEDAKAHFLILSGYADFDYAKKAIDYSVDGYLLKPVDEDELIEDIQRISALLTRESELKLRSAGDDLIFREHVIESYLFHNEDSGIHLNNLIQLGLSWQAYQVLIIEAHGQPDGDSLYLNGLKRALFEHFDAQDRGIVFSAGSGIGILLKEVVTQSPQADRLYHEIAEVSSDWNWHVYAAVGKAVRDISSINDSYKEAAELLHHRFLFEGERVIMQEDLDQLMISFPMNEGLTPDDEADWSSKLYYALDIRSKEAVERVLEEMEEHIVSYDRSEQTIKSSYAQIISMAVNKFSSGNPDLYPILQDYSVFISDVYRQPTFNMLKRLTREHFVGLIDRLGGSSKDAVLKQMIDFIQRNFSENLRLELLAEVFNYNSAYLGKLFKNHTGEYFNVFLDKIRIEKAKELLQQGLKVHQVANRVGYANVDYFHSKFKKYVGVSPSSFRDADK